MTSEPIRETKEQELKRLVARAERHQKALGLSDNAFALKYKSYVGSAKTWRARLCSGNYEGVNIDRILKRMRAFCNFLDGGMSTEAVYEDLPIYYEFWERYRTIQSARTDRRAMVFLGETGVGKSVCARSAVRDNPSGTLYIRCQPTWKDNHLAILNGILKALGKDTMLRKSRAFDAVMDSLKSSPQTLIFDESHDGGVALLKLAKSIIDETDCRIVIMAFPTLWKRMLLASSDAHAEARQLFGRTQKPIFDKYAGGTTRENVEAFLRRSTSLNGSSKDIAGQILEIVRHNGNLRLLADIIEAADTLYMESETELDGEKVIAIAKGLANAVKEAK